MSLSKAQAEFDPERLEAWDITLFDAIYRNDARQVVDILKLGVDIYAKNASGQNAIDFARFMAHHDIAKLLEIYAERLEQLSRGITVYFSKSPVSDPPKPDEIQDGFQVFGEGALQKELAKLNAPEIPLFEEGEEPAKDTALLSEQIRKNESPELEALEEEIRRISGRDFRTVGTSEFVKAASKKIDEANRRHEENSSYNIFEGFLRAFGGAEDKNILIVESRETQEDIQAPPPERELRKVVSDEIKIEELNDFIEARRIIVRVEDEGEEVREDLVDSEIEATQQTPVILAPEEEIDAGVYGLQAVEEPMSTQEIFAALDLGDSSEIEEIKEAENAVSLQEEESLNWFEELFSGEIERSEIEKTENKKSQTQHLKKTDMALSETGAPEPLAEQAEIDSFEARPQIEPKEKQPQPSLQSQEQAQSRPQIDSEPEPVPEPKIQSEPKTLSEPDRKIVIEVVRMPQKPDVPKVTLALPVSQQEEPLSKTVRLLRKIHLGDERELAIGSNPQDRTECVTRRKREFCIEAISWPEDWAAVFDLKTSLPLGGGRALVRYEEDIAASYHVFFETKDFSTIRQFMETTFGQPSHVWERKRRVMIKGIIDFEVVAWQTQDGQILELIESADYRSVGLKEGHGVLRLVDVNDRTKPLNGIRQSDLMILGTKRLRSGF